MEPKYIVAIVALGLFLFLFLVFFVLLARRRRMEAKLQAWLHEVYSNKNLIKNDYDFESDEEELNQNTAKNQEQQPVRENLAVKEEDEPILKEEDVYSKIEIEGIEEITGNYKPQ